MREDREAYRTCLYCTRQCCAIPISSAGISRNNPSAYRCQRAIHRIEQSRARALYLQPPIPRILKSLAGCVVYERCPKDYKITHCSLSGRYLFPSSVKWPYFDAEKYKTLNRECATRLENSMGRRRRSLLLKIIPELSWSAGEHHKCTESSKSNRRSPEYESGILTS